MARTRSRWALTTRARFGVVLGLAAFAVAGVQVAFLSTPPTIVQIVVVAFWTVVGLVYLAGALARVVATRRERAAAPASAATPAAPSAPAAPAAEEIVPVPVRPARPRPRPTPAKVPVAAEPAVSQPAAPERRALEVVPARSAPTTVATRVPSPAPARASVPVVEDATDAFTVRALAATAKAPGPTLSFGPPAPRTPEPWSGRLRAVASGPDDEAERPARHRAAPAGGRHARPSEAGTTGRHSAPREAGVAGR